MSRSKKSKPLSRWTRDKLVAIVVKEAKRLGRADDFHALNDLLTNGLAWISNDTHHSAADLSASAVALAPLALDEPLVHAAQLCVWWASGKEHEPRDLIRRKLEPLGVPYASCGCCEYWAGDSCCDVAAGARKRRNEQIDRDIEYLRTHDFPLFSKTIATLMLKPEYRPKSIVLDEKAGAA